MTALSSAPLRITPSAQTAALLVGSGLPLTLLMANPWLSMAAVAVLGLGVTLLWRPPEPAALLFAFIYQWLQVTTKIWHANVLGVPVEGLGSYEAVRIASDEAVHSALWLSLIGLTVLVIGIRAALGREPARHLRRWAGTLNGFSAKRLFLLYLVGLAAVPVIGAIGYAIPGLRQPLLQLVYIRFFFLFMFAVICLTRQAGYSLLVVAVVLEVTIGLSGYFSDFKTVFFLLAAAYLTVHTTLRPAMLASVTVLAGALLSLALVWTAVKPDYRDFVNQGTQQQVVLVPLEDRAAKLAELAAALDRDDLAGAADALVNRIAYVDFFADVIHYVPDTRPHEGGQLWWAAIAHVLQPRLFFPDKPVLPSDSELTMIYTGHVLASDREGTSISMGYMAESYIDFGPIFMFLPIFVFGIVLGLITRYFLLQAPIPLYGQAAAAAILFLDLYYFEIHNVKLVGGVLTAALFYIVWLRFAVPMIDPWLRLPRRAG